jgi:hypothetical protein
VTLGVHAGDHHDVLLENAIVESVGESGQEDAASAAVDDGVSLGVILDGYHSITRARRNAAPKPGRCASYHSNASSTSASASDVKRAGFTAT